MRLHCDSLTHQAYERSPNLAVCHITPAWCVQIGEHMKPACTEAICPGDGRESVQGRQVYLGKPGLPKAPLVLM